MTISLLKTPLVALAVGVVMPLFCGVGFAFSSEPDDQKVGNSFSENVETIRVTFHRQHSPLTTAFTRDDISLFPEDISAPKRSVADIISQSPGVELNGQGGLFQSYNIRGFSRWRIKTEVDGIPIITDRRAGNSISFLPPEMMNALYIQKGPSSTLYGSGAMGGVISAATFSDDLLDIENVEGEVAMAYQPQDQAKNITIKIASQQSAVGFFHKSAANAQSATGEELNSQYQQSVIHLANAFQWRSLNVSASAMYSAGNDIGKSAMTFPNTRVSLYPQDDHFLAQIKISSNEQWLLQGYVHQQQWQSDVSRYELTTNINGHTARSFTRKNSVSYESDTFGGISTYVIPTLTDNTWFNALLSQAKVGVEWLARRNIKISESEFDSANELAWQQNKINAQTDNLGLFFQNQWRFADVLLSLGARFDKITLNNKAGDEAGVMPTSNVQADFLSLSSQIEYPLLARTTLKIEAASAFRFPTVSELFFSGETPRGTTQGNAELMPEESVGIQLTLHHQLSEKLSVIFAQYYYDVENYIERFSVTDTSRSYRNSDEVNLQGGELTARWLATKANNVFETAIGLQWQQGDNAAGDTVDDILPYAVKWQSTWHPHYSLLANTRWVNQVTYRFAQNKVGPSETPRSSQLLWHLGIEYHLTDELTAKLALNNITNADYYGTADEDAALQPERTSQLSIRWSF